jgi:hypothetical protein
MLEIVVEEERSSETRLCVTTVIPCACAADEWVHGFTIKDGQRAGVYLAARRERGAVRYLDIAATLGAGRGTMALRVFVNVRSGVLEARVLGPLEVEGHPALALGSWLDGKAILELGVEVHAFVNRVVLGDDRLAAHLFDLDVARAKTELAMPARQSSNATTGA